jgi:hypothetical protein
MLSIMHGKPFSTAFTRILSLSTPVHCTHSSLSAFYITPPQHLVFSYYHFCTVFLLRVMAHCLSLVLKFPNLPPSPFLHPHESHRRKVHAHTRFNIFSEQTGLTYSRVFPSLSSTCTTTRSLQLHYTNQFLPFLVVFFPNDV